MIQERVKNHGLAREACWRAVLGDQGQEGALASAPRMDSMSPATGKRSLWAWTGEWRVQAQQAGSVQLCAVPGPSRELSCNWAERDAFVGS